MSRIGLDNVVFAPLTTDDGTVAPTYDAIQPLVGAAMANINPNSSVSTDYLDDGPAETAVTLGQTEFTLEVGEVPVETKATLLGQEYNADGVMLNKGSAVPPFVAVGFRTLKSNGSYRYIWLYKVKFRQPEENHNTKGESIEYQHDTLIGSYIKLNYNDNYQATADEDDTNAATIVTTWFDSVYVEPAVV